MASIRTLGYEACTIPRAVYEIPIPGLSTLETDHFVVRIYILFSHSGHSQALSVIIAIGNPDIILLGAVRTDHYRTLFVQYVFQGGLRSSLCELYELFAVKRALFQRCLILPITLWTDLVSARKDERHMPRLLGCFANSNASGHGSPKAPFTDLLMMLARSPSVVLILAYSVLRWTAMSFWVNHAPEKLDKNHKCYEQYCCRVVEIVNFGVAEQMRKCDTSDTGEADQEPPGGPKAR